MCLYVCVCVCGCVGENAARLRERAGIRFRKICYVYFLFLGLKRNFGVIIRWREISECILNLAKNNSYFEIIESIIRLITVRTIRAASKPEKLFGPTYTHTHTHTHTAGV